MRTPLPGKPENFLITAGVGTGLTELTAFDHALLQAGVGNYNLLRVSSILPVDAVQRERVDLPLGSLLPIAYGFAATAETGMRVTAAVAIVIPEQGEVGLIMEYSGSLPEEEARKIVEQMGVEALKHRNTSPKQVIIRSASAIAEAPHWTCAFAGVALW